jgi:hypothetical protein
LFTRAISSEGCARKQLAPHLDALFFKHHKRRAKD